MPNITLSKSRSSSNNNGNNNISCNTSQLSVFIVVRFGRPGKTFLCFRHFCIANCHRNRGSWKCCGKTHKKKEKQILKNCRRLCRQRSFESQITFGCRKENLNYYPNQGVIWAHRRRILYLGDSLAEILQNPFAF